MELLTQNILSLRYDKRIFCTCLLQNTKLQCYETMWIYFKIESVWYLICSCYYSVSKNILFSLIDEYWLIKIRIYSFILLKSTTENGNHNNIPFKTHYWSLQTNVPLKSSITAHSQHFTFAKRQTSNKKIHCLNYIYITADWLIIIYIYTP